MGGKKPATLDFQNEIFKKKRPDLVSYAVLITALKSSMLYRDMFQGSEQNFTFVVHNARNTQRATEPGQCFWKLVEGWKIIVMFVCVCGRIIQVIRRGDRQVQPHARKS